MLPELPERYYLDNVLTLFAHVDRVYADILEPGQTAFLQTFAGLSEDGKRLYIRLLNRSRDWYRIEKLDYPEIGDLRATLAELEQQACIQLDPRPEPEILLSLYTKPELLSQLDDATPYARLRRSELEAELLDFADSGYLDRLYAREPLLQLLGRDDYLLCQMLFFGNLNQSMTDFVLRDLGLYQFESYPIDPKHRPYRSQVEILQHWLLYQLELMFELIDRQDPAALIELHAEIPDDIDAEAPAWRKAQHLRYEVARQLERCADYDNAIDLYQRCQLSPSRERIARIHAQCERPQQALDDCVAILDAPLDDEETQFAASFAPRIAKRHGLEIPAAALAQQITHQPDIENLELEFHDSVEIAVAEHYREQDPDGECHYLENSLFNGVLGLLLWDVVFAPVNGAFFNAFQYRPSDFYTPDFQRRRKSRLAAIWQSIRDNDDIRRIVMDRYTQKHGLMNPLVNWQDLDPEIIGIALERIPFAHWRAVFDRILLDLRNNRAGFPDLVLFPATGDYCLVEVKGPGDNLQKNQQRWMQYFHDHAIPHRLARVTWKED